MVYKFPSIEGYANRSILLRLKEKINHGQFFFLRWCDVGVGKNLTYYAKATKYNTNTITGLWCKCRCINIKNEKSKRKDNKH